MPVGFRMRECHLRWLLLLSPTALKKLSLKVGDMLVNK